MRDSAWREWGLALAVVLALGICFAHGGMRPSLQASAEGRLLPHHATCTPAMADALEGVGPHTRDALARRIRHWQLHGYPAALQARIRQAFLGPGHVVDKRDGP